jgi:WD40 repeat protein
MQVLTGYTKPVIALALTPDGSRLFSAGLGQTMIWEWDLGAGKVTRKLKCSFAKRGVYALAISPRGDFLVAIGTGSGVGFFPLDGGELRRLDAEWGDEDHLSFHPGVAIHPHRQLVAASFHRSDQGYGFQTWDLAEDDRTVIQTGHKSYVSSVAFSPDGGLIATASQDSTVRLWPLDGGEPRSLKVRVRPVLVAFHPDGKVVAAAAGRSVYFFEVTSGELQAERKGHSSTIKALAFSPDGRFLASAGGDGGLILRDAKHEIIGQHHLDIGKLASLAWRADSSGLAVGGEKLIAVRECDELLGKKEKQARGEPLSVFGPGYKIQGLSYSPDGRMLASWSRHPSWRLWDLSGGPTQAKKPPKPNPSFGQADVVSWSPDSKRLATSKVNAFLGMQHIGNVLTEDRTAIFLKGLQVAHLAFMPDGRLFVAITAEKKSPERWARLEVRKTDGNKILVSKRIEMPDNHAQVTHSAFSRDGQHIYAAFTRHGLYRWTPASDEFVHVFKQGSLISSLEVSADERLALTTGGNTALLWSLPEGKKLAEFKHQLACSGAALLPGDRILTGCYDGIVRIWDAGGGKELHALDPGMGKIHAIAVAPDHMTFAAGVQKSERIVLMDVPE